MRVLMALTFAGFAFGQPAPGPVEEKVDTPRVHAYVVSVQPHASAPGSPSDSVLIYLDNGIVTIKESTGPSKKLDVHRGDIRWSPAASPFAIENTSDHSVRILRIDLKSKPAGPLPPTKLDPVIVDAKHYHVELENDQVRVLRIHYDAHETSPEHEHILNRVVLFLNDQKNGKRDEVHISGAQKHTEENPGDTPADRIAVELK
jgi:hypothetical protein